MKKRREFESRREEGGGEEVGREEGDGKKRVREKRGFAKTPVHSLCGGNQLANHGKTGKNSPIPIPKTLSHPPVTTIELGRPQMIKE